VTVDSDAADRDTVASWSRRAARRLMDAGIPDAEARQDVSVLGRHTVGWDAASWIVRSRYHFDRETTAALDEAITRRARREPVAYIMGVREFFGRDFKVTPAVLIPRPETERLIEVVRGFVYERVQAGRETPQVLDIGTGSGCIAITIALDNPATLVTATDTSSAALEIARENSQRLGAADRVRFVETNLAGGLTECMDVVVSNPPYVALAGREALAPEVRDFEPASALFGGQEGMDVIDALIPEAWSALLPGGLVALEIGATQRDRVVQRLFQAGFEQILVEQDLAGHPRIVSARKPGGPKS
jgi:release factor glutamine methyltransferase